MTVERFMSELLRHQSNWFDEFPPPLPRQERTLVSTFNRLMSQPQQPRPQRQQPWNSYDPRYRANHQYPPQEQRYQPQGQQQPQLQAQPRTQGWTSHQFQSQRPANPYQQQYQPPAPSSSTNQRPALPTPLQQPQRQPYGPNNTYPQQRPPYTSAPRQQLALPEPPTQRAYVSEATDEPTYDEQPPLAGYFARQEYAERHQHQDEQAMHASHDPQHTEADSFYSQQEDTPQESPADNLLDAPTAYFTGVEPTKKASLHQCKHCAETFPSKNKLFKHLSSASNSHNRK